MFMIYFRVVVCSFCVSPVFDAYGGAIVTFVCTPCLHPGSRGVFVCVALLSWEQLMR